MALATLPTATAARAGLPDITSTTREVVARANERRLALQGDQQLLRARYEEIMRWLNPPWDAVSRRVDPRGEAATAERAGENILHADFVNPTVDRWAVLQMAYAPILRVKPPYVAPPVDNPERPEDTNYGRQQYELDRAIAQLKSSQMENQTNEWAEAANFHRTLLWAVWCKEAFGKAVIKTGWDPDDGLPTAELYENPSTVYYGWTKRYGTRRVAWASVIEEIAPAEANRRFGIALPTSSQGNFDYATWTGLADAGDMDQRPEQQGERMQFVTVMEYWELAEKDGKRGVSFSLILADRVIEGPTWYPWKRVPFHILENQHIPTWQHGKSMAEVIIPINTAFDDTLDREHQVVQFESGPRFKGMNMVNSGDEVDIPAPFHLVPLNEGEDIQQIDVRVDFFPGDVHLRALYEAIHRSTGLTPIAWGMSPNAQTSGRALSAEWRAVELPLHGKLITMGPEIRDIALSWWDYAEAYDTDAKAVADGYRRIEVVWVPVDVRDKTERSADILNRLNGNMIDLETAIEESGYENVDEIMAKIKAYLLSPIWNPLRRQQYLVLEQLELQIRQQRLQTEAMEAEAGAAAAPPPDEDAAERGETAAVQDAQKPTAGSESQNQPGQAPGAGLLPLETGILSQTPLEGGIGNRIMVNPGEGPAPTSGVKPR